VYLDYTAGANMKMARFRYEDGGLETEATLVDGIRAGPIHDCGRIHFGPDERPYVSTGDAGQAELAQDPDSLNGKFLRLDRDVYRGDGGVPEVISSGHRNPQGFDVGAWLGSADRERARRHRLRRDQRDRGGRQLRLAGGRGTCARRFHGAARDFEETIAPSGATFVSKEGSAWSGDLLVAALAGEQIRRVRLEDGEATVDEPMFEGPSDASARWWRARTVPSTRSGATATAAARHARVTPDSPDRATAY
jgi:glucose/arabinose dehydrogenase